MNIPTGYVPSVLSPGEQEFLRQQGFTRWLSPDLLQASMDFCRNIGLFPIYCEGSAEGFRYLFWRMPRGSLCEVRTGRTAEKFVDFDCGNEEQGRKLLSLHIGEDGLHSAVWLSEEHWEEGRRYLGHFGISAAIRIHQG